MVLVVLEVEVELYKICQFARFILFVNNSVFCGINHLRDDKFILGNLK